MEEKMADHKLDAEELEIENSAESFRSTLPENWDRIKRIIERTKKNRAISMRISEFDLTLLKEKAQTQGIPYQTLLNIVIHKYVTNQFLERDEAIKSFNLLKSKNAI